MKSVKQLTEDYPVNSKHMVDYINYQERYKKNPRESDKTLVQLLRENARTSVPKILDIGCSTGNLLRLIQTVLPSANLWGADLNPEQIEYCKNDISLKKINFKVMDVCNITNGPFDCITANAVLAVIDESLFSKAIESIFKSLLPMGVFVCFDWFHPWKQDLVIVEKTDSFPEGLPLHFRSYETVISVLKKAGFERFKFHPFSIPIDIPKPNHGHITTYTEKLVDGGRLQFRGCLSQPWNHLVACKT